MSNKKKIIVICTMVVLLVAAAYLNVFLNSKNTKTNANNETGGTATPVSFFASYRDTRQVTRNEDFSYLEAIIASTASSEEAKANAEAKQLELIETADTEMVLEALIKAKGFSDAIVTVNTNNVNVVVNTQELTANDAQQILAVVTSETGVSPSNVIILNYA